MSTYFRSDGWVKSAVGPAVSGAQVWFVQQPANLTVPPTPLALIYSDVNGLVPITQPILTDNFGHYDFYTLAGIYTLIVGLNGQISQVYPDQNIGAVGAGNPLTAGANITIVGNVISAVIPPFVALQLQTNEVNNGSQQLLDLHAGDNITLTDNGSGRVTIVASSAAAASNTFYQPLNSLAMMDAGAPGISFNASLGNGTHTDHVPTATLPGYYSNDIPSGSQAGGNYDLIGFFITPGILVDWKCRVWTLTSGSRYWIGFTDATKFSVFSGYSSDTPSGLNTVAFRYSTSGNYFAVCGTPSAQTSVDTGIAFDATAPHIFEIKTTSGNGLFYIDGALVATVTTNVPAASTNMTSFVANDTNVGPTASSFGAFYIAYSVRD